MDIEFILTQLIQKLICSLHIKNIQTGSSPALNIFIPLPQRERQAISDWFLAARRILHQLHAETKIPQISTWTWSHGFCYKFTQKLLNLEENQKEQVFFSRETCLPSDYILLLLPIVSLFSCALLKLRTRTYKFMRENRHKSWLISYFFHNYDTIGSPCWSLRSLVENHRCWLC